MKSTQNITLRVEPDTLNKLRDYAYTERITLTKAVNNALSEFLFDKKGLLKKPEAESVGV